MPVCLIQTISLSSQTNHPEELEQSCGLPKMRMFQQQVYYVCIMFLLKQLGYMYWLCTWFAFWQDIISNSFCAFLFYCTVKVVVVGALEAIGVIPVLCIHSNMYTDHIKFESCQYYSLCMNKNSFYGLRALLKSVYINLSGFNQL